MYACLTPSLYIGNFDALSLLHIAMDNLARGVESPLSSITCVINVGTQEYRSVLPGSIVYIQPTLPQDSPLDNDFATIIDRYAYVHDRMKPLIANGFTILIVDDDGRGPAPAFAAYHLLLTGSYTREQALRLVNTAYMSDRELIEYTRICGQVAAEYSLDGLSPRDRAIYNGVTQHKIAMSEQHHKLLRSVPLAASA